MLMLNAKFLYGAWSLMFITMSLFSFIIYLYCSWNCIGISLSFIVSSVGSLDFSFSLLLDPSSLLFTFCVLFISSVVMSFSMLYMSSNTKSFLFSFTTVLFVMSMLLVINMSDLIMIMLGWDGLGIVSFFLIVYYQSSSTIFSGLFTVLMNRIGDSLIIVSLMLMSFSTPHFFAFSFVVPDSVMVLFLLVAFMTKSAIFPFSPWLPAAMAAPTPISSLVHSSTLVTAGLYLMMRFSSYIYQFYSLMDVMVVLGVFTSFYAGLNSLFETDLKKLVALSTLSHLGFICMSIFTGMTSLAFLHLLSHAMFKSLLFMTVGNFMCMMDHFQESRYLSSGYSKSFFTSSLMTISLFSLMGAPFFSGFYSKDLVLESMTFSSTGYFLGFIIYVNVIFTYIYTLRIFSSVLSYSKSFPYSLTVSYPMTYCIMITTLSLVSVFLCFCVINCSFSLMVPMLTINYFKWLPLLFSFVTLIYFSYLSFPTFKYMSSMSYLFSSMIYLSLLCSNSSSNVYSFLASNYYKSSEYGFITNSFYYFHMYFSSMTSLFFSSLMKSSNYLLCMLLITVFVVTVLL